MNTTNNHRFTVLLNKVCDLANLIEVRFCSGYAKTVVLSCFQRGYRARGLPS